MARSFTSTRIFAVLAALVVLLAVAAPAGAHHKDGHDNGGSTSPDGAQATASAEDSKESKDSHKSAEEPEDDSDNLHPSVNDRETNNGATDDEQGASSSEPDADGHGPERDYNGTDKTGGPGGINTEDQDGNNGCGNDDDFEDDNEGWCGQHPKPSKPQTEDESKDVDDEIVEDDDEVQGEILVAEEPALPEADVLGLRVRGDRGAAVAPAVRGAKVRGGVLPFTGTDALSFIFLALGLVAAGYLMLRARGIQR